MFGPGNPGKLCWALLLVHLKLFGCLKFTSRRPRNIHSSVISSFGAPFPFIMFLNKLEQVIKKHIYIEIGRQSFTPKKTVIGCDVLWRIPRNHLVQ